MGALSVPPGYLPGFLRFDPTSFANMDAYYQHVHQSFSSDWNSPPPPVFAGLPVYYDDRVLSWNLPEGFWHAVSQNSPNTGDRVPDILRCERILWIKAILTELGSGNPAVKHSIETKRSRKGRRSVIRNHLFLDIPGWCHLVILERSGKTYRLVSAFHIGEGSIKCQNYRNTPHIPLKTD